MNIKNDRNIACLKLGALKTKTNTITAQPYTCKNTQSVDRAGVKVQTDWDVLRSAKDEVDEDWVEGGVKAKDWWNWC